MKPQHWCGTSHPFLKTSVGRDLRCSVHREGPRWPHYTSRYLKCLHMWTVMLFAAVELLSRPPKALRDRLFLLFSPSPSPSPLSRSIIIAHMLFQRHPEWNSSTSSMAITCSCWRGRDILKRMFSTEEFALCFFSLITSGFWALNYGSITLNTINLSLALDWTCSPHEGRHPLSLAIILLWRLWIVLGTFCMASSNC